MELGLWTGLHRKVSRTIWKFCRILRRSRDYKMGIWGQSPTAAEAACRHCLQILTAEMILKILHNLHLILAHPVSQWAKQLFHGWSPLVPSLNLQCIWKLSELKSSCKLWERAREICISMHHHIGIRKVGNYIAMQCCKFQCRTEF